MYRRERWRLIILCSCQHHQHVLLVVKCRTHHGNSDSTHCCYHDDDDDDDGDDGGAGLCHVHSPIMTSLVIWRATLPPSLSTRDVCWLALQHNTGCLNTCKKEYFYIYRREGWYIFGVTLIGILHTGQTAVYAVIRRVDHQLVHALLLFCVYFICRCCNIISCLTGIVCYESCSNWWLVFAVNNGSWLWLAVVCYNGTLCYCLTSAFAIEIQRFWLLCKLLHLVQVINAYVPLWASSIIC